MCFVHLPPSEHTKLSAQSAKCAFLVYASHKKGYLCYDPKVNCIFIPRNVVFFENQYFFQHHPNSSPHVSIAHLPSFNPLTPYDLLPSPQWFKPNLVYERRRKTDAATPPPHQEPPGPAPDLDPIPPVRRSARISQPPDRNDFSHTTLLATLSSIAIPYSYSQAMKHECW